MDEGEGEVDEGLSPEGWHAGPEGAGEALEEEDRGVYSPTTL